MRAPSDIDVPRQRARVTRLQPLPFIAVGIFEGLEFRGVRLGARHFRKQLQPHEMTDVCFALAGAYGAFMGTYPVPVKTPSVLAAGVHPIIFQSYKRR